MDNSYSSRLNAVIPGGAHTYSRGDDQFPSNAPEILTHGKGCFVTDPDGKKYLDFGMALRSVAIGYAESEINEAVIDAISRGNNLTRASTIELEAAELLTNIIDSADMVKFAKNGSSATTAAIKLARAFTGKNKVIRCRQHPFFSYDDWFIGSTVMNRGIPETSFEDTLLFDFNNIESLSELFSEFEDDIACVIMEPSTSECPNVPGEADGCCGQVSCTRANKSNFLHQVKRLCEENGSLFILDEMITGFRLHDKGAQYLYDIKPDLTTFGKAMANGFSVAAVCGKREIMELGGIKDIGAERLFLLSSTHGAEMSSLAAFIATMDFYERNSVVKKLWDNGMKIRTIFNDIAQAYGLNQQLKCVGPSPNLSYVTLDSSGNADFELRTLLNQELINNNILMPWISVCYHHDETILDLLKTGLTNAVRACSIAIENNNVSECVASNILKPVFRKFN